MDLIADLLFYLNLTSSKELPKSMQQSKTLTVMVIIGLFLFLGFTAFLFYMAGKQ